MFGNVITKYCNVCKKEVKINVSMSLIDDNGKEYYIDIYCPKCNKHLSKDAEEEIRILKEKGFEFGVCLC